MPLVVSQVSSQPHQLLYPPSFCSTPYQSVRHKHKRTGGAAAKINDDPPNERLAPRSTMLLAIRTVTTSTKYHMLFGNPGPDPCPPLLPFSPPTMQPATHRQRHHRRRNDLRAAAVVSYDAASGHGSSNGRRRARSDDKARWNPPPPPPHPAARPRPSSTPPAPAPRLSPACGEQQTAAATGAAVGGSGPGR